VGEINEREETHMAQIVIYHTQELGWTAAVYDDSRAPGERCVGEKIAFTSDAAAIEYAATLGYEATSAKYPVGEYDGGYGAIDLVAVAS